MKVLLGIGVVLACMCCGLLGLTAGINLNPESTVKFVPNWGSLADWVSGIGSVSAAIVALGLAARQRKEGLPQLKIDQHVDDERITIDAVSVGGQSAVVLGVFVRSARWGKTVRLSDYKGFPKRLEYGEIHSTYIEGATYRGVSYAICGSFDHGDYPDLEIIIETTTTTFAVSADEDVIGVLEGHLTVGASHF